MEERLPQKINERVERAIAMIGILLPLAMVCYSVLIMVGTVTSVPSMSATPTRPFLYSIAILSIGTLAVLFSTASRQILGIYLVVYHTALMIYLVFFSGFTSPIMFLWALLFLVSYLYFGRKAGTVSLGLLLLFAVATSQLYTDPSMMLIKNIYWTLLVMIIGTLTASTLRGLAADQREVEASRHAVSSQQNQTTTLINNLADAIISTDQKGRISVYNAAALSLLDTNAELESSSIADVLSLTTADGSPIDILDLLHSSNSMKIRDDLIANISGEPTRLEITCSAIRDTFHGDDAKKEVIGYILILRDVTKSKSLEEERDEFISVVSHELRTPITIAEGTLSNAELMINRPDVSHERLSEAVTLAHDQVIFLARMVNDLSTLSRAERCIADTPEDIDIDGMLHDLYNEYSPQAAEKDLHFNLDLHGKVGHTSASRLYLKELLQNFVTNAIKYTRKGTVTLSGARADDGRIVLSVRDSGIGISKSDQKRIFDKFYRAEDYRTRETNGTGLGLYVAVKLAKKLGTTIDMKSRLNHGSTFSVTLPADKS